MKYRHCDGKLVLKVTDNRQVLIIIIAVVYFRVEFHFFMCSFVGNTEIKST